MSHLEFWPESYTFFSCQAGPCYWACGTITSTTVPDHLQTLNPTPLNGPSPPFAVHQGTERGEEEEEKRTKRREGKGNYGTSLSTLAVSLQKLVRVLFLIPFSLISMVFLAVHGGRIVCCNAVRLDARKKGKWSENHRSCRHHRRCLCCFPRGNPRWEMPLL